MIRRMWRVCWLVGVLGAAACTKHNPAQCCDSMDQCFGFGLSQEYPCATGEICDPTGTCIMQECQVATDCSGTTRFCIDHLCTNACRSNADCTDAQEPLCAPDGTCGSCLESSACPASAPTCDVTTHDCRKCSTGADCASNACDVTAGMCVDTAVLAYITDTGTDSGSCGYAAPCRSIAYADSQLGTRTEIVILGSAYTAPSTIALNSGSVTISSSHAVITGPSPIFRNPGGGTAAITIKSTTLGTLGQTSGGQLAIGIQLSGSQSKYTLDDVNLEEPFENDAGTLLINNSVLDAGGLSAATTTIQKSKVHDLVTVTGGTFRYDSNQYSGSLRAIESNANDVQIIDSVFIGNGPVASLVDLHKTERLAFCTFVNQPASSVTPYSCDPVSPNSVSAIINAVNAQTDACSVDHSLFNGSSPGGTGNVGGTPSSFFVNLSTLDLHLEHRPV